MWREKAREKLLSSRGDMNKVNFKENPTGRGREGETERERKKERDRGRESEETGRETKKKRERGKEGEREGGGWRERERGETEWWCVGQWHQRKN